MFTWILLGCLPIELPQDIIFTAITHYNANQPIMLFKNNKIDALLKCDIYNYKGILNVSNTSIQDITLHKDIASTHITLKNAGIVLNGHISCPFGKTDELNSDFIINSKNDIILATIHSGSQPMLDSFELKYDTTSMNITMTSYILPKGLNAIMPMIRDGFVFMMRQSMNEEIRNHLNDFISEHSAEITKLKEDL